MIMRRRRIDLEEVLARWSPVDEWTARQALTNTLIVGKSGSGKSSGAGDFCLRALVGHANSGGVIFAAKPEDKPYVERVFREERTLKDLYILEPGGQCRFNVLDDGRARGDDTRDLTQALMIFKETLTRTEGGAGGGENAGYFAAQERRMLHNAIEITLHATGRIDPWVLQSFINGAALSLAEINDEQWKGSYHARLLAAAEANAHTPQEKHEYEMARQYWTYELPRMNDRTRTSIEAGVMATLHPMNSGTARELLATTTNVGPELLEGRKWLLVNAPIAPGDVTSALINGAVKYAFQRYILKRHAKPGDPLLCLFCDEFQKVANSYDSAFLAECRSHRGCLVALTQSIHALYADLQGRGGEHQTDALLTNFGTVVVHTLGDATSAKNWSDLLGMRRELFIGTTTQPGGQELYDVMMGRSLPSLSTSEQYQPVLQPAVFLSGLRCGGPPANIVDGVVIRSGNPFRHTGENYLITSFKQR